MKASICIATYDHANLLDRTLASIFAQSPTFDFEVILVDDGGPSTDTLDVVVQYPKVEYIFINRPEGYRNPAKARNVAYKAARGDVVISQSDDVIHSPGAIQRLVDELREGEFLIGTVFNVDENMQPSKNRPLEHAGIHNRRPLFFLGSMWRKDLYAAGGCDERYELPGYEDDRFADSLMHGLGLEPRFVDIIGYHQDHPRPPDIGASYHQMKQLYISQTKASLRGEMSWMSPGAPWSLT